MTKQELRKQIRERKKAADPQWLEAQSLQICQRVTELAQWKAASIVLLYHALPDEVNTETLLEAALKDGKVVLLPVVVGDELELRHYASPADLQVGSYGILEPTGELFTALHTIDLAVIPGMSFDTEGHRLGRGKGYYDRLLCQCPSLYKVGICFDFQMVNNVPSEPHDFPMDVALTN